MNPLATYLPPDEPSGPVVLSGNIAELETSLEQEREGRKEERFYWVLACCILVDPLIFNVMNGGWGFAPLLLLQIIMLIGLAKRLGVDWAVELLSWTFEVIAKRKS